MNRNLIIVIALVILGALGVGSYLMMSKKNPTEMDSNPTTQNQVTNQATDKKSLRDLMSMTTNQTCTFKDDTQNTGTIYSGGSKVRADFSGTTNGKTTATHMISDGTNVYLWFDGAEKGMKMGMADMDKNQGDNTTVTKNVDVNKQVDYQCSAWKVDTSKFALPDLEFQDLSSMMNSVRPVVPSSATPAGSTNTNASQCAACDNLPADSATQCRQALNCN